MASPIYDRSQWPIFQARMPAQAMSEQEFAAHIEELTRVLMTDERVALLVDARGAPPLNAKQRAAVAAVHRRAFERDPDVLVGIAVVLSTALERGIMTAIVWAARTTFPTHAFATPELARVWLREQLRERGKRRAGAG